MIMHEAANDTAVEHYVDIKQQDTEHQAKKLWLQARDKIIEGTESSLMEAAKLLERVSKLISHSSLLALLHHDLGVAYWRLVKLGVAGARYQLNSHWRKP